MSYERYRAVSEVEPPYAPGDPIRSIDDDVLGIVQFCRQDGWVCAELRGLIGE